MAVRKIETPTLDPETAAFYRRTMRVLQAAGVPFLVGGAYAFARYTGIERHTKDFDVFVREPDCRAALAALGTSGCHTDLPFPHWLGKAHCGDAYVDVIFSSGNAVARVDDGWFEHAVDDEVLGVRAKLCPPEETIWSKAFVQERERFDGADVMHLLHACGSMLDWERLLVRFGDHWRVLFQHLVTFGFVYPSDRDRVPAWVMHRLIGRLQQETDAPPPTETVCRGTLLSREQYLKDVRERAYRDGRRAPAGRMTAREIAIWSAAIGRDE